MNKPNKFIFYQLFVTFILVIGCDKDKTPTDCGCNSKIVYTIAETKELTNEINKTNIHNKNNKKKQHKQKQHMK